MSKETGMNPLKFLFYCCCGLSLFSASPGLADELDLRALIRDVEQQYMGVSSHARTIMRVKTAHWDRTLEMEAWSLGRDYYLVQILEPAKERGVATLKRDREIWNYLPKVDRIIKVPPSMMGGSWMGSHITNDDLVKASHVDEDYTFTLLEETDSEYHIECLPREDAAVVWGKIIYRIGKQPRVPLEVDYFDEEMVRVRQILFDQVQIVDDRIVPMRLTVLPLEQPDERTVFEYRELSFDVDLEPNFFSLRRLKQR